MRPDIVHDETQPADPDEIFYGFINLYLADELPF